MRKIFASALVLVMALTMLPATALAADGAKTADSVPVQSPSRQTIAVGTASFAVKTDGSLWSWGYNGFGQLGDGTTTDRAAPKKIMDNVKYVSTSEGGAYAAAVKTDGTLWAWGRNDSCQ